MVCKQTVLGNIFKQARAHCLHTVESFQVLLYNSYNSIHQVICLHLVKWLNIFIWSTDGTLAGTTTSGQSNGNEGVLHIPQSSRTGVLPSDCLMS